MMVKGKGWKVRSDRALRATSYLPEAGRIHSHVGAGIIVTETGVCGQVEYNRGIWNKGVQHRGN